MSKADFIIFISLITIECFFIFAGNIFTIFVFWKNRKKLKRTSFILINLSVADLLVGLVTPASVAELTFNFYQRKEDNINSTAQRPMISCVFQSAFSSASVFFLVLISLERAYALIWPLRHRAASTRGYIYSVISVWLAAISAGGMQLLAVYGIVNIVHWMIALCTVIIITLILICLSYLAIRTKLQCRGPALDAARNNENVQNQSRKLSRTLFVVIGASLVLWFPSIVVYCIYYLCPRCVPAPFPYISAMLHSANSLVNPIIYSFRMSVFQETLKRMKIRKKSKQYRVNNVS